MRRSASRRRATEPRSRRRLIAAAGALVVFGAIIGVTQISNADDNAAPQPKKTVSGLEILAERLQRAASWRGTTASSSAPMRLHRVR